MTLCFISFRRQKPENGKKNVKLVMVSIPKLKILNMKGQLQQQVEGLKVQSSKLKTIVDNQMQISPQLEYSYTYHSDT